MKVTATTVAVGALIIACGLLFLALALLGVIPNVIFGIKLWMLATHLGCSAAGIAIGILVGRVFARPKK